MLVYQHFPYRAKEQRWNVPEGVTTALFEAWGAAGGMPSELAFEGKKREVVGGTGVKNDSFFNDPAHQTQLGKSFANNAGYAAGIRPVVAGEVYYVYVGGNGGPGHSTIKLKDNGSYEVAFRGGASGYNGGGQGGAGAHVFQNLFNARNTNVHYKNASMPNSAKAGQLWWDTSNNLVKTCNLTYTAGNGTAAKWDKVTDGHPHAAGPSGGGGGGATDFRRNANAISSRVLVAGGGGGAAGTFNLTGVSAWSLRPCPAAPSPPFGADTTTTGATGPDNTWTASYNYLVGGWGGGGIGGGTGPLPNTAPTTNGGFSTSGDAGGPATDRHTQGTVPGSVNNSAGKGGTHVAGGPRGVGGSGGQDGASAFGGNGADAAGGQDDFCAGGGGGGGGFFGGGGGGQGFKVTGDNSAIHTRGGGGGGGSNYAASAFTAFVLAGAARPPFSKGTSGTGANGLGGFARISYHLLPIVTWNAAPRVAGASAAFNATFTYQPAQAGGKGIAYYIIGTATSTSATFPTSQTTFMVTDPTATQFSAAFTAPANGVSAAFFVQVVDLDGDASPWLKQIVTGLTAPTPSTITSPASGAAFEGAVTVNWTVGASQTPLAAYRLGVTGQQVSAQGGQSLGATIKSETPWRRGGSRVNLAIDPGFLTATVWSSTANAAMIVNASFPGVSGSNGRISWLEADDYSAENHSTVINNLVPGTSYRLHLDVASALTLDPRPVLVEVRDNTGVLTSAVYDLSAKTAGAYLSQDIEFTPQTQSVYFAIIPSGTVPDPNLAVVYQDDWEGGTVNGWAATAGYTAAVNGTQTYQGDFALNVQGFNAAQAGLSKTLTAQMTAAGFGAGQYVMTVWGFAPTASNTDIAVQVTGAGVNAGVTQSGTVATRNAWVPVRVPFIWDGAGAVTPVVLGNTVTGSGTVWYDLLTISKVDTARQTTAYGNPDTGQITYVANMLVEPKYEEDKAGYLPWFSGGFANGTGLTVSWSGTANASPSIGTGVNIVTGVLTYTGQLQSSSLYLDTMNANAWVLGQDPVRASQPVKVNPSTPTTPTVAMQVDSTNGLVRFTINAADGANAVKTTYFDIYRGAVRVATGLTPDQTTRVATYYDVPNHAEAATYTVRAFDQVGGWADQTTGTVT